MTSAAEQLAANLSWSSFAKATDLKKRLLFVLGAMIVYRLGTFLPLPMVSAEEVARALDIGSNNAFSMFSVFSGGAIERMSIFALSIMPYISASIVMQLMTAVTPSLEKLKKDGEAGRKKINQYTRYGTVFLAAIQGYGLAVGLSSVEGAVTTTNFPFFAITTVITVVGGTLFLMWLGEQVTQRGIGNGISLLIFAGIVAELPSALGQLFTLGQQGTSGFVILMVLAVMMAVIVFVVFIERAQRRLLVQYPRQQRGNQMFGGASTHLPLKVNAAGVIPPIFASSLLLLPTTLIGFAAEDSPGWVTTLGGLLSRGQPMFLLIFSALIVFFCFFYTALVFNPKETAENLKRNGGFIPGVRPGQATADYIDTVMTRLTVIGAAYITLVCILPELLHTVDQGIPFLLGGTSILIMVTVTMDTVTHIQSHLLAQQYEGAIKKAKLRGRRK